MPRFLLLLLCAFSVLSLGVSPAAHAAEGEVCVETGETVHAADLEQGQPDSGGSDNDGYAHQHGGCHGHHFAALTSEARAPARIADHDRLGMMRASALVAAPGDAALRPPRA